MGMNAEPLFNDLGEQYEAAYGNNPDLVATVQAVLELLPAQSTVLDVGSGTGKPVSHMLAAAGHHVTGIDISERMAAIARRQVPQGTVERADMRTYKPPHTHTSRQAHDSQQHGGSDYRSSGGFDAIFAVYSLYQVSPGDTHAMIFRFAEWLKHGTGILVLGVTPADSLPSGVGVEDRTWGSVWWYDTTWMQKTTDAVYLSKDRWMALLRSAGLSVHLERLFTFCPQDPEHNMPEDHWLLVARRTEERPLLGPYPYPEGEKWTELQLRCLDASAWRELSRRVQSAELGKVVKELVGDERRALEVSNGSGGLAVLPHIEGMTAVTSLDHLTKYTDNAFETVIGTWILDHVSDVTQTVQEMVRITDRSAPQPRIMLLQGAPWNEVLRFQNAICTPLAATTRDPSHQGYLLDSAIKGLSRHGFNRVSIGEVSMRCSLPEENLEERCSRAADVLVDLWHSNDVNKEQMRHSLIPQLRMHFRNKPHEIGFDMVVVIAEPGSDQL
ncbi:S-adenosyl-L-methionine-dependent methyltransferase [Aspergillus carlsbadensis]|nr:S-adenosyl-L-methionine-dependent methyltransferase [Aspergillus carlsbadensis]